jgi:hypothetical protein
MKRYLVMILLSLTVLLFGCVRRMPALSVPDARQVTRIVVTRSPDSETTITRPDRIVALLRFFAAHNDGWYMAETTFPGSQVTVSVFDNERLLIVVWVGSTWIGGRNGDQFAPNNRLHDLSAAEAHELETLLGT